MGGWALLCGASGWSHAPPAVLWAPGEQGLSAELTGPAPQQWKGSGGRQLGQCPRSPSPSARAALAVGQHPWGSSGGEGWALGSPGGVGGAAQRRTGARGLSSVFSAAEALGYKAALFSFNQGA